MPSGNVFLGLQDWNDSNVCILRNPKSGQNKKCVSVGGSLNAGANSFTLQGTKSAIAATDLDVYMMAAEDAVFVDISNTDLTRVSNQLSHCAGYSLPVYDFSKDSPATRMEYLFDYIANRANLQTYDFKWFALGQVDGKKATPVLVSPAGKLRMVYRDGAMWFVLGGVNKNTKRATITASTEPPSDWITETIAEMGGAEAEVQTTVEEDNYMKRLRDHTLNDWVDYWQSTYMWSWQDYLQMLAENEQITLPQGFNLSQATLQLPYNQANKLNVMTRLLWFDGGTKTYLAISDPLLSLCVVGSYPLVGAVAQGYVAQSAPQFEGPINDYQGIDADNDDGTLTSFAEILNYHCPTLEGFEVV